MLNDQQLLENLDSAADRADRFANPAHDAEQGPLSPMGEAGLRYYDLIKYRLDFTMRAFTNSQDLIRFLDQKTGMILSAVGLLTTAQGALMLRAFNVVPTLPWQIALRVSIGIAVVVYVLIAFAVVTSGVRVFSPSTHSRRDTQAPGFLFPLIVLNKHNADEDVYRERLMQAMPSELLHDLANQIVEIANVYRKKNQHLQQVIHRFRALSFLWLINMLLLAVSALVS